MRHYGIPQKLVTFVEKMYDETTCRILNERQLTDSFEIKTGVKQGCLLSPFLFILALDWLLKEVTRGKRNGIQWTLWNQLDDLDFADDIALLSHNHDQMQNKTKLLRDTSQTIGLRIHSGKSKILKVKTSGSETIMVGGSQLEEVSEFTYLGSIIDDNGGTGADIKTRIGKA